MKSRRQAPRKSEEKVRQQKESFARNDAIAQLEKWAADLTRVAFILPRDTNMIHHRGRIVKIETEIMESFQFISDSGMLVWLLTDQWKHITSEHVPDLVDAIHIEGDKATDRFTISSQYELVIQKLVEEAVTQLRIWANAATLIVFGCGGKVGELAMAGYLDGPQSDGSFLVQPVKRSSSGTVLNGRIDPQSAENIHMQRSDSVAEIILTSGTSVTYIAEVREQNNPLLSMPTLSKLAQ